MAEIKLNTGVLMIGCSDYMEEADAFLANFSTANGGFDGYQAEAVDFSELMDTRSSITLPDNPPDYIRGLRICYGLSGTTIRLYYVPILGFLENSSNNTGEFAFSETSGDLISIINTGALAVFTLEDGALVRVSSSSQKQAALASANNYYNQMLIKRSVQEDPSAYNAQTDCKAAFFPFEELEALHAIYNNDDIYFTSVSTISEGLNRHSIILSHTDPINDPQSPDQAANYAALCPPHCGGGSYVLA